MYEAVKRPPSDRFQRLHRRLLRLRSLQIWLVVLYGHPQPSERLKPAPELAVGFVSIG